MFRISVTGKGFFAWVKPDQGRKAVADLRWAIAEAHKTAYREYMTGRLTANFRERLEPSAFGVYGMTSRSAKYQKAQLKKLGSIYPYYSPRGMDFGAIAKALANPTIDLKRIARAMVQSMSSGMHMRDLIRIQGSGWNVRFTVTSKYVRSVLRLPGARALNKGGSKNAIYRQQLADLSMGGGRDKAALQARLWSLIPAQVRDRITTAQPVKMA
jgi:hypothetical protein